MTETMTLDLTTLRLDEGAHVDRTEGVCMLEAAAWLAGERHTDHPRCVCPVLSAFGRTWNDALDDEQRQRLIPYIPRMVGTAGDGHAERRAWLATDWLVRVQAPAWLRLIAQHDIADALEQCAPVLSAEAARAAQPTLDEARKASAAARAAARAAAWDAAGAAVRAAARDAARDAVRAAARDAAGAAARNAARTVAASAARERLRPTVELLRESAFVLLDSMVSLGEEDRNG